MKKIIIGILLVSLIVLFLLAYMTNSLRFLGLCAPGYKSYLAPFAGPSCYIPSGFAGQPCDRKTDCGNAGCMLVNPNNTIGKGVCVDLPFGCHTWIDENGTWEIVNNVTVALCVD